MNNFIKSKRTLSIKDYNKEFGYVIEEKDYKNAKVITYDSGLHIFDFGDYFLLELNRSVYKENNIKNLEEILYSFYIEEIKLNKKGVPVLSETDEDVTKDVLDTMNSIDTIIKNLKEKYSDLDHNQAINELLDEKKTLDDMINELYEGKKKIMAIYNKINKEK